MSLLSQLKNRASHGNLKGAIHENVYIKAVDVKDRVVKNVPHSKFCFIKFAKLDPDTKQIKGEYEASWFKLKFTDEYLISNAGKLLAQIVELLELFYSEEEIEAKFTVLPELEIDSMETFEKVLKTKDGCIQFSESVLNNVEKLLTPFVGDTSKVFSLKLVYDKTGKHINIPKGKYVSLDSKELEFTAQEKAYEKIANGEVEETQKPVSFNDL